ncbi:MAG TPA: hypothetical protein G4N93_05575 [Dehalococcoidia bacterium]|jgi:ferredoxin|nr:hypothetical protein [Dehalococcoidia bacterium]
MIVAKQKDLEVIVGMLQGYERILVLGCGTCTAICLTGGDREVGILASSLRLADKVSGKNRLLKEHTVERQCEWEFLDEINDQVKEVDAILSLGCGVGVQAISERFPDIPVLPGLDTLFMGMPQEESVWVERCSGCGNCILDKTAGICPVTRCTKGLLNGPCGGTNNGKCEVDPEKDCAWTLIYQRLEKQGKLELFDEYHPPRNFQAVVRPGRFTIK